MKTNKVTKLGVSLLSVAVLGVVAPVLTDESVFGISIVKAEETRPLKYTIAYYDKDTGKEIAPRKTGTINPGETVNIYKDIDGYQVVSNFDEWMPGFNASYRIMSEYFGFSDGRLFMDLSYKKVNADAKPSEEVKPEPKPSDTSKPEVKPSETPKPEVKPETKPSETPKPEVKPEPAPKGEEKQEPLKYRIRYLDEHSREIASMETGVLNPGESINIHKDIEGYQVVSNFSWMPGYNLTHDIASTFFYGAADGYMEGYLRYKKLDADAKPSEEVKPETKPSETPKPEVKPEPAPKEEEKQEPLKYRITYYDSEAAVQIADEMTGTINPGETINIYKNIDGYEITSKYSWMPNYDMTYDIANEYFYGSRDGYNDMLLEYKKVDADAKPSEEVKPETKPSETPKPEVKPETKPSDTPKPEVKPETKPSETPKSEVKPETKPSDTPKPEVKLETKPSDTPKPEVKPEPKPSDTSKPEVKPEPKPSDTSKPEVKPELKPQTNSNTAPTAPVKPVGQTSNSKADKPTSKKETPALPNTGEQSSSLSLVGLLLASLGLAGLTYKGRH